MWRFVFALTICAVFLAGCQEIPGFTTPAPTPAAVKSEPKRTLVLSEDKAMLVVQEYLLSKAVTAKAKTYLSEFYSSGLEWSARSELLKDGTRTWNVMLEAKDAKDDSIKLHWKQAGWVVFDDGRVLPSPQYNANALRIETDLQELSGGK
ncbi:MAG: hypothetical protein U1D67_10105 [Dehalococcoidia bacterium]|nr:hypothetical protein [Dehalococcoidia bacterium]